MRAPELRARRIVGENRSTGRRPSPRLSAALRLLLRRPRECVLTAAGVAAAAGIIVNGLFLQPGPHPAPIFAIASPIAATAGSATAAPVRSRGPVAEIVRSDPVARPRPEIVADIQRELARRGFYDAPVDGAHGARTDAAIREFEQAAGLKPTSEANEALLQNIVKTPAATRSTAPRKDPIAGLIASSRQLVAIQRALSDFGYGPLETNGVLGPDTRAAIERFERDRKMPITGQMSERLMRELAAMTGRPL